MFLLKLFKRNKNRPDAQVLKKSNEDGDWALVKIKPPKPYTVKPNKSKGG